MSNGNSNVTTQANKPANPATEAGEVLKALGEGFTKTVAPTPRTAPDPKVSAAVALGWQMAELYRDATRQPTGKPTLPVKLPTIHEVPPGRRTEFAIAEVGTTLESLGLTKAEPSLEALSTAYKNPETDSEDIKRAVFTLHLGILRECGAHDVGLAKAYELGRAHADTSPEGVDQEAMIKRLGRYRLDEIGRWLADLATRLPEHSSRAVRISMARWKIAAKGGTQAAIFNQDPGVLHRALDRQVQIWRSLLTGEKQAKDMLDTEGYARAVGFAVADTRRMITSYLWRFLPYVLVTLAILAAGIWGIATYEETSKVIASLLAIVGALGLSWKGVATTVGRLAGDVEEPIWLGSVDLVIADAITQAPADEVGLLVAVKTSTAAGGTPNTHGRAGKKAAAALPPGSDTEAQLSPA